jgi:GAF domain-containing protein
MPFPADLKRLLRSFQAGEMAREAFLPGVTEWLSGFVNCSRSSIWLFSPDHDFLICEDLFVANTSQHSRGDQLQRARFPDYFWSLEETRAIVAPEARTDPNTACFTEIYFIPLDIHSLLDAAVLRNSQVHGVVCCEQVGQSRIWGPADINAVWMAAKVIETAGI